MEIKYITARDIYETYGEIGGEGFEDVKYVNKDVFDMFQSALCELVAEFDTENKKIQKTEPGTIGYRDTGGIAYARTLLDVSRVR